MMADSKQISTLLKTAKGQIEGIINMVNEDRYCVDISNQLLATGSIIAKVNKEILKAHIKGCVASAMEEEDKEAKIQELIGLIDKLAK